MQFNIAVMSQSLIIAVVLTDDQWVNNGSLEQSIALWLNCIVGISIETNIRISRDLGTLLGLFSKQEVDPPNTADEEPANNSMMRAYPTS